MVNFMAAETEAKERRGARWRENLERFGMW